MPGKQCVRLPTILIPYPGPLLEPGIQDIFLYLRPETNGVLVESMLMRVIKGKSKYCSNCKIVYLANMPGDFILKNGIVEQHYAVKIRFARAGKKAFTDGMRRKFSSQFGVPFKTAPILGAFTALKRLGMHYEDLFKIWVPPENFRVIYGQSIKLYQGYYIVNYDIPALLHKNSRKTDIAVMICRSGLSKAEYHTLVQEMGERLIEEKVITRDRPLARTFHYSRGPFEQVLDGIGYLYDNTGRHLPYSSLSFMQYLLENGCTQEQVLRAIKNPIMRFKTDAGIIEENIMSITDDATYKEALRLFRQRTAS
jgi:hypothetical protein